MNMKLKKLIAILLAAFIAAALIGCGGEPPPDDGTQEPAALNGNFQCGGLGMFSFNGDGKTIGMKVTSELSSATGLPEGLNDGTYVFLFDGGIWRYDKADTLQIMTGDEIYRIACVPGGTGEGSIKLLGIGGEELVFIKYN